MIPVTDDLVNYLELKFYKFYTKSYLKMVFYYGLRKISYDLLNFYSYYFSNGY